MMDDDQCGDQFLRRILCRILRPRPNNRQRLIPPLALDQSHRSAARTAAAPLAPPSNTAMPQYPPATARESSRPETVEPQNRPPPSARPARRLTSRESQPSPKPPNTQPATRRTSIADRSS